MRAALLGKLCVWAVGGWLTIVGLSLDAAESPLSSTTSSDPDVVGPIIIRGQTPVQSGRATRVELVDDGDAGPVLVAPSPAAADELAHGDVSSDVPHVARRSATASEGVLLSAADDGSEVFSGHAHGDELDVEPWADIGDWLDNTELFIAGDQYRNVGDTNYLGILNTSVGARGGFNTGFGLGDLTSARLQLGMSLGLYDPKGRLNTPDTGLERQFITTLGFYKRSDAANGVRCSWGAVYDVFSAQNWGNFSQDITLGQIRLVGGWALSDTREIGLWGAIGTQNTYAWTATVFAVPGQHLRPTDQLNIYYKKHWAFGADTQLYVGAINANDYGDWQVGFNGRAPMNERVSLYASANYVAPSDPMGMLGSTEEQWNFSVGMVLFLGRKAVAPDVSGQQGLPLLPVADNGSFLLTPRR